MNCLILARRLLILESASLHVYAPPPMLRIRLREEKPENRGRNNMRLNVFLPIRDVVNSISG